MNRDYVLAVLERAVKTAAQAALLVFGADQVNAMTASWGDVFGFAAGGFVLSVLTSLATSGLGGNGPSATTEHVTVPRHRRDETGAISVGEAFLILVGLVLLLAVLGFFSGR